MPVIRDMLVFLKKRAHPDYPFNDHNITFRLVDKLKLMLFHRSETPPLSFNLNKPYTAVGQDAREVGIPVSGLPNSFLHVAAFEGEFVDKPALYTVFTLIVGGSMVRTFNRSLRLEVDACLFYGFL